MDIVPENKGEIHVECSSPSTASPSGAEQKANHLDGEKSPYLLQHAYNPVNWYPWGKEAFDRAKSEEKPIFLSIGYSTCHWCHVMESESFSDQDVAAVLNRHFIAIKVDREERPDIDQTFMTVCQMMNEQCGWPLNLVLTPNKEPFFASTYLPKTSRRGLIGLIPLLDRIAQVWQGNRQDLLQSAAEIVETLKQMDTYGTQKGQLTQDPLRSAQESYQRNFDHQSGGFGQAPKFPTPHHASLLLRLAKRFGDSEAKEMALKTLLSIRMGGIFDQIGFGVHRYSVDAQWLVPHFEKMLYDQALVALAFLEAFQFSEDTTFCQSALEIFEYLERDLRDQRGGFYCGEDADSEGVEGRFYLWTPAQVEEALGSDLAKVFNRCFDITPEGNFEGENIPHLSENLDALAKRAGVNAQHLSELLAHARNQLLSTRSQRIRPDRDDKILTGWNGLTIAALSRGAAVLSDNHLLQLAESAADFVMGHLKDNDGRLLRRWIDGEATIPGFLDDYTFMIWGLIELYQAGFNTVYLKQAVDLLQQVNSLFLDGRGGFYDTGADTECILTRGRTSHDGAIPATSSVLALNLLRLGTLLGREEWIEQGRTLIASGIVQAQSHPLASAQLLIALDFALGPYRRIVLCATERESLDPFLKVARRGYDPHSLILLRHAQNTILDSLLPLTEANKIPATGGIAQVCTESGCLLPAHSPEELEHLLRPGRKLEKEEATARDD